MSLESIYYEKEPIPKRGSENFLSWAPGTQLSLVILIYDDDSEAGSDTRWAFVPNNTPGEGGAQRTEILCGFHSIFTKMIVFLLSKSSPDTVSDMTDLCKYYLGFWHKSYCFIWGYVELNQIAIMAS